MSVRFNIGQLTLAAIMALAPQGAAAQDGGIAQALGELSAGFPAGEAEGFSDYLASAPEGVSGDTIGHLLFMRRQFDRAAWFFGADALADMSDPVTLNNFAAMLVQSHGDAPDANPEGWLQTALAASRAAVRADPANAAFQNNLGNAARHMGLNDEAVTALRAAVALAPGEALFWANLARALEAAGDTAAAAEALARAHGLSPNGMAVAFARRDLPASAPYSDAIARSCNVDFRCQEICPRSIIGGLMSVSCEIENASAQMACQEGKPFATSYNCQEDLPDYGILIPGLNAGFSIAVPGFSVHVLVDGEGNVDVRGELGVSAGPLGGYVRGDGHFSPENGVSVDNLGGGVRVSLLPSGPAADVAGALGHPPAHIELEGMEGAGPAQINLEAFNAGVISY